MIAHRVKASRLAVLVLAGIVFECLKVLKKGPKSIERSFPPGDGGDGILGGKGLGDLPEQGTHDFPRHSVFFDEDRGFGYRQQRSHFRVFLQKLPHPRIKRLSVNFRGEKTRWSMLTFIVDLITS